MLRKNRDFFHVSTQQKKRTTITGWWCNNHLEKYESQWDDVPYMKWKIKHV
jgi:hypothetical protein